MKTKILLIVFLLAACNGHLFPERNVTRTSTAKSIGQTLDATYELGMALLDAKPECAILVGLTSEDSSLYVNNSVNRSVYYHEGIQTSYLNAYNAWKAGLPAHLRVYWRALLEDYVIPLYKEVMEECRKAERAAYKNGDDAIAEDIRRKINKLRQLLNNI